VLDLDNISIPQKRRRAVNGMGFACIIILHILKGGSI
jgi:hypothetical protein